MDTPSEQTTQPIPPQEEVTPIQNYSHHSFFRRPSVMYVLIALILMGGLGVGLVALNSSQDVRSKASNDGTILTLFPATKTGAVGETFTVGLTMNTGADAVSAVELRLSYDPTAIQIVSFNPASRFPVILVPETHTNGAIAVTLAAKPPIPFKGTGIVGTWTVKILAAKQSSISFTSATQVAALRKKTNALASTSGSSITGTGDVSITSTPATPASRKIPMIPTPIKREILKNILKK